jgi:hypothetical protein
MLTSNAFLEYTESVSGKAFTAAVEYLGLSFDTVVGVLVRELENIQQPTIYTATTFYSLGESQQEVVFKTNLGNYSLRVRGTAVKNSYDIYVTNLSDNTILNVITLTSTTEPAD